MSTQIKYTGSAPYSKTGPTGGEVYLFVELADGSRVASVENATDAAWFLEQGDYEVYEPAQAISSAAITESAATDTTGAWTWGQLWRAVLGSVGFTADALVSAGAVGTLHAKIRRISSDIADLNNKLPASLVSGRLSVDGSGVTQPISAASLPLPTGAASAANQETQILAEAATAVAVEELAALISGGKLPVSLTDVATATNQATIHTDLVNLLTGVILAAGNAVIGKVGIDQTTPGVTNAVMEHSLIALSGGQSEAIAISAVSAQSSTITTGFAVVTPTVDCFFRAAADPTAVADGTDQYLLANNTYRISGITSGHKLAFIVLSASGTVYISPGA
jgi:hypothetical protein